MCRWSFQTDSYDPCPCASGEKFKFCCKPAFREIVLSQALAQEGKKTEAIKQIQKAKSLVGETAEVVCREAIVYSFFDRTTSKNKIKQALEINPKHPRANYIQGIILKEAGDLKEAAKAYKNAKNAWEKALVLMPSDTLVKRNLKEFIYENSDLNVKEREISPFVRRFFAKNGKG